MDDDAGAQQGLTEKNGAKATLNKRDPNTKEEVCARCQSLEWTSLSGPPFSLTTPTVHRADPERHDVQRTLHQFVRISLQPDCRICAQVSQILNLHGPQPYCLRIWWNQSRRGPRGDYVHSCRLDGPDGYTETVQLLPVTHSSPVGCEERNLAFGLQHDEQSLDYDGIKQWLHDCDKNHNLCILARKQINTNLRVIDCKAKALIMVEPGTPYVALSYVWGKPQPSLQTSHSCLPTKLPKTIEDSMVLVLKLGLDYLWVDRYCINQTDEAEKQRLLSMMDLIYMCAEITIVAAAGDGPDRGLPGVCGSLRTENQRVDIGPYEFMAMPDHRMEVERSKWHSRGW